MPCETFHCSLSFPDDDSKLQDENIQIGKRQSFLSDEEAETENEESNENSDEEDETEEDSNESDEEEEEDLDGDDEDALWNMNNTSLVDEFDDLDLVDYDDF